MSRYCGHPSVAVGRDAGQLEPISSKQGREPGRKRSVRISPPGEPDGGVEALGSSEGTCEQAANLDARRPYYEPLTIIEWGESSGNSSYHSAQLSMQKRFSRG